METKKQSKILQILQANMVPILFTILCLVSIKISGQNASYVLTETVSRVSRNAILIVSLILPVLCGMGLNFSIVLGAMAGEIGLILITHWSIDGLPGIGVAAVIATVIAVVLGALTGVLFNKVKGQEMITGMILGFFAVGVYDLIFIYMVGSVIPMVNPEIMLSSQNEAGETVYVGLRNTIDFHEATKYAVDNAWKVMFVKLLPWLIAGFFIVSIGIILYTCVVKKETFLKGAFTARGFIVTTILLGILQILITFVKPVTQAFFILQIPVLTAIIIALVCLMVVFITKTKLGQDIKTVGMNMQVATAAGIDVDRTRIIATVLSTVIASWGQIIFLQNIGNVQTFNSHEQVGTYAVAALLVGGASIDKASMGQVFTGTILFHVLFFITPLAGKVLFSDPQLGEYFRVFLCYGIIAISLILYAWKKVAAERRRIAEENEQHLAGQESR
ncbi:MAG TPA: ABC transporter permease [Candidatus Enterocloster excrementigallinarum]|uniref:ABC transporter permease n=1 Tax=Candidatus Enterocloster excrementigallinarum TaxID=2838558 RepID=A0A9D2PSJ5_9FIRM|nr:ABC transporter permease [Candidatus Enterocloster excrementigallinarum]